MFFQLKKMPFLTIFTLGLAEGVKNTHARYVKSTQTKRLA